MSFHESGPFSSRRYSGILMCKGFRLQHRSHLDGARTLFAVWIVSCTETCCAKLYDVFLLVHRHDRAFGLSTSMAPHSHFYADQI